MKLENNNQNSKESISNKEVGVLEREQETKPLKMNSLQEYKKTKKDQATTKNKELSELQARATNALIQADKFHSKKENGEIIEPKMDRIKKAAKKEFNEFARIVLQPQEKQSEPAIIEEEISQTKSAQVAPPEQKNSSTFGKILEKIKLWTKIKDKSSGKIYEVRKVPDINSSEYTLKSEEENQPAVRMDVEKMIETLKNPEVSIMSKEQEKEDIKRTTQKATSLSKIKETEDRIKTELSDKKRDSLAKIKGIENKMKVDEKNKRNEQTNASLAKIKELENRLKKEDKK